MVFSASIFFIWTDCGIADVLHRGRDPIFAACPFSQIDQAAAWAAKRKLLIFASYGFLAGGTEKL
jgi:hypothetical protein